MSDIRPAVRLSKKKAPARLLTGSITLVLISVSCVATASANAPAAEASNSAVEITYSASRPPGVPPDYLSTPFGWVNALCVHELGENEVLVPRSSDTVVVDVSSVSLARNKLARYISRQPGATPETAGSTDDLMASIPSSIVSRAAPIKPCPYTAFRPDGAAVPAVPSTAAPTKSPGLSGWIETGRTSSLGSISYLHAEWNVPPAPKKNGALVYIFPAFSNDGTILQPVLQWGSGYFGGNYWSMASWIGVSGNYYHSTWQRVTGSTVSGDISGNGCKTSTGICSTWTVTTYDWGSKRSTAISRASWKVAMKAIYGGALEVYNASSCDHLPGTSVKFKNFYIENVSNQKKTPSWSSTKWSASPNCGYSVAIGSDKSITLKY